MTHSQHLLNNAIWCIEHGVSIEDFETRSDVIKMYKLCGVSPAEAWSMAQSVLALKEYWQQQKEDEMVAAYGYKLED
jgi:hypothetical protein